MGCLGWNHQAASFDFSKLRLPRDFEDRERYCLVDSSVGLLHYSISPSDSTSCISRLSSEALTSQNRPMASQKLRGLNLVGLEIYHDISSLFEIDSHLWGGQRRSNPTLHSRDFETSAQVPHHRNLLNKPCALLYICLLSRLPIVNSISICGSSTRLLYSPIALGPGCVQVGLARSVWSDLVKNLIADSSWLPIIWWRKLTEVNSKGAIDRGTLCHSARKEPGAGSW